MLIPSRAFRARRPRRASRPDTFPLAVAARAAQNLARMPEGHTIHRAARNHHAALAGRALSVTSPQGRADFGALAGVAPCRAGTS